MGVVLAFLAAWWLRGLIAVGVLAVLTWFFLVPSGTLGKPGQATTGQAPVADPRQPLGPTGLGGQPRVAIAPLPPTVAPIATTVPSAPRTAAFGPCRAVHDYGLDLKPEVSTSMAYLRVQYWTDGQPERETYLPASAAGGGRFILAQPLRGHVWEFDGMCTDSDMMADVNGSIARRKLGGANNAGYVEWQATGLFRPAVPPS